MGDTRYTISEVASGYRQVDATSCIGHCYSYFTVFYVLCPSGIVVF
jgi:hypothetical protein